MEELGTPSDELSLCTGDPEYNRVARRPGNRLTTKVALNRFHVPARFYELHTHWRNASTGAVASQREHPSEAAFDQHRWLDFVSK